MPAFVVLDDDGTQIGSASFYGGQLDAAGVASEMVGGRVHAGDSEADAFAFFADGWSNGYVSTVPAAASGKDGPFAPPRPVALLDRAKACRAALLHNTRLLAGEAPVLNHPGHADQSVHGRKKKLPTPDAPSVPMVEKAAPEPKKRATRKAATPKRAPAPKRTADLDAQLEAVDAKLEAISEKAAGPRQVFAAMNKKSLSKGLNSRDIDASQAALDQLESLEAEGIPLANRKLDLLTERDGAPWGGTTSGFPNAKPGTAPVVGADHDRASRARDEYVMNDPKTIAMNASIRSGRPTPEARAWRDRVQQMTGSQRITEDTTLYRGAALPPEFIAGLKVGAVLRDPAPISTDEDQEQAERYGRRRRLRAPDSVLAAFSVKVPAGTPAYDAGVGEFVLGPDSAMRVVGIERTAEGARIFAELLPAGGAA